MAELCFILDDCLQDFPDIQALRKEQEFCLVNLARIFFRTRVTVNEARALHTQGLRLRRFAPSEKNPSGRMSGHH